MVKLMNDAAAELVASVARRSQETVPGCASGPPDDQHNGMVRKTHLRARLLRLVHLLVHV